MTALGFILFMIGACGMDSNIRIIPVLMIAVGATILLLGRRNYNG